MGGALATYLGSQASFVMGLIIGIDCLQWYLDAVSTFWRIKELRFVNWSL